VDLENEIGLRYANFATLARSTHRDIGKKLRAMMPFVSLASKRFQRSPGRHGLSVRQSHVTDHVNGRTAER